MIEKNDHKSKNHELVKGGRLFPAHLHAVALCGGFSKDFKCVLICMN